MAARFGREIWSLVIPEGWHAKYETECATLVGPSEIGALQISAAFKDSEVVETDLQEFAADHLDSGAIPRSVAAGDFVGFEIVFTDETSFWRQWYLRNGRQMLFVTYNCSRDARGIEDRIVDAVLASFLATDHTSPNSAMQPTRQKRRAADRQR